MEPMNTPPNDGGPAFPCHGPNGAVFQYGMTKREWFAGQALQGVVSTLRSDIHPEDVPLMVNGCYLIADAMLAASKRKEDS